MPTNPETKSVNIQADAHHQLSKETKRLGVSQNDYTTASVLYFAKRGLNPLEMEAREGQLIMQEVKKLGDRIFRYMQEQERGLLLPMLEEMLRSRITLERVLRMNEILVNNLSQQLNVMNEAQLAGQREALKKLRSQNEEMIEMQVREALKSAQSTGPGKRKEEGQLGKNGSKSTI